ncbi:MAG: hypothetical protein WD066_07180 [Planctomycetaceae bacterium]
MRLSARPSRMEDLYRAITQPSWWKPTGGRPSSAAFNYPKFSADMASLTTPRATLDRVCPGANGPGVVGFDCGIARRLDFDPRRELDEDHPDNAAHVHVYFSKNNSQRKKRAQKLAQSCLVVLVPTFD